MSRLEVPIQHRTSWATGDILLWAKLDLLLKDGGGNWHSETFQIDTATHITTMSAYQAKRWLLPMPALPARGIVHRQTGLEIRSGYLRFQIAGLSQEELVIACYFLGDPDSPLNPQLSSFPRRLLQPFQLIDTLRFSTDYNP